MLGDAGNAGQGRAGACGGFKLHTGQQVGRAGKGGKRARLGLQNHPELAGFGKNGRDNPLAKRAVQRLVHRIAADAQPGGTVSVNGDKNALATAARIHCNAAQAPWHLTHSGGQLLSPQRNQRSVRAFERHPKWRRAGFCVNRQVLRGLQKHLQFGHCVHHGALDAVHGLLLAADA